MSFFDVEEIKQSIDRDDQNVVRTYSCDNCQLFTKCSHGKQSYRGNGKKGILVIGDPVSHIYDQSDGARKGSTYNYLKTSFKRQGIDLEEDCWYAPSIRCYTKEDKYGIVTQDACSRLLVRDINLLKPKMVVTTSESAWDVLHFSTMRGRAANASYFDWCGETIPSQTLKTWVVPIYDTKEVMAEDKLQSEKAYPYNKYILTYDQHIKAILSVVDREFPVYDIDTPVSIATNEEQAIYFLKEVLTWKKFAFDWETTGLRPYREGQKLWSVSFSNGIVSYSMFIYDSKEFMDLLRQVLQSPAVKIAHNKGFERLWSIVKVGTDVNRLIHDPMLAWHVWHCKKKTSLKFISYALYGVLGYDAEMDEYLKPSKEEEKAYGANAINTIHKAPQKKLLRYGGVDSLLTYWENDDILAMLDPEHMMPGYRLLCDGEEALTEMTHNGFRIDMEQLQRIKPIIQEKVDVAYKQIMDDPTILHNWYGGRFNPSSDADIRNLLYNVLKFDVLETTDSGLPSVDVEALEAFRDDLPMIPILIEYRRWYKLLNTFLKQLEREVANGVVHSSYSLNNIATYRSGSSSVNIQNQPARDKEVVEYLRSLFFPLKGHKLISLDYKSLEVMGSAAITGDKNLIRYVTDPSSDMHKKFATVLFIIDAETVTKGLRNAAKTQVFASFYGSYYVLIAKMTWKQINSPRAKKIFGFDIKKHTTEQGITTYEQWEEHVKKAEEWLWNEEFKDYKKYKQDAYKEFQETGEIHYPTGFTYKGVSSRNQVGNGSPQGSSFHINLWSFTKLNKEMKRLGMKSKLLAEIHDSIIVSLDPAEEEYLLHLIWKIHTQDVREMYDWFNVPLILELSAGGVDEPWSKCKEVGELKYTA